MRPNLQEIIDRLELDVLTTPKGFGEIVPTAGYASDLLSCVMTGARPGGIWLTLQSHINIVAVAALLDLSAIIITENAKPDEQTITKAIDQNITILLSQEPTYQVCGKLWELGLRE